jgi:8-oxo-dGTP pyrophosphatase MutT (NUDIX family)
MSRKEKHKLHGRQCAALPLMERDGQTWVMMVTSRERRRWVLPKGWTEKRLAPHEAAAAEAYEEAGIRGAITAQPVGAYVYSKQLGPGRSVTCQVDVFPLQVETLLDDWPEKHERERRWFTLPQAAQAVEEGSLVDLFLSLASPQA